MGPVIHFLVFSREVVQPPRVFRRSGEYFAGPRERRDAAVQPLGASKGPWTGRRAEVELV